MKIKFLQHTDRKKLFTQTDHLLVGLSGGKDSMALAHLLLETGFNFSVAHCNFGLRGEESDMDEAFVKDYFGKKNTEVISTRFQTREYAAANHCSIQMAARELRYNWFQQLLRDKKYTCLLTAHHANDTIETFFINLLRGTGLNGLKGIPEKNLQLIRPLLFASRGEIDAYVEENKIPYREDSSNAEEKYLRNKLRKQVLPLLKEINPSLEETMKQEIQVLRQSYELLSEAMKERLDSCCRIEKEQTRIDLKRLGNPGYRELLLLEALKPYGFNGSTVNQLNESIEASQPGKQFYSASHIALLDRNSIVIRAAAQEQEMELEITGTMEVIERPVRMQIRRQEGAVILPGDRIACLDAAKVVFPLQLTRWKEGDSFRPLGMKGSKKLSDFFVAQKMSIFEKQQQWILRSGTKIVWVLGKRVDERYRVDESTRQTLILEWQA